MKSSLFTFVLILGNSNILTTLFNRYVFDLPFSESLALFFVFFFLFCFIGILIFPQKLSGDFIRVTKDGMYYSIKFRFHLVSVLLIILGFAFYVAALAIDEVFNSFGWLFPPVFLSLFFFAYAFNILIIYFNNKKKLNNNTTL